MTEESASTSQLYNTNSTRSRESERFLIATHSKVILLYTVAHNSNKMTSLARSNTLTWTAMMHTTRAYTSFNLSKRESRPLAPVDRRCF